MAQDPIRKSAGQTALQAIKASMAAKEARRAPLRERAQEISKNAQTSLAASQAFNRMLKAQGADLRAGRPVSQTVDPELADLYNKNPELLSAYAPLINGTPAPAMTAPSIPARAPSRTPAMASRAPAVRVPSSVLAAVPQAGELYQGMMGRAQADRSRASALAAQAQPLMERARALIAQGTARQQPQQPQPQMQQPQSQYQFQQLPQQQFQQMPQQQFQPQFGGLQGLFGSMGPAAYGYNPMPSYGASMPAFGFGSGYEGNFGGGGFGQPQGGFGGFGGGFNPQGGFGGFGGGFGPTF